jgi:hypothetical protein
MKWLPCILATAAVAAVFCGAARSGSVPLHPPPAVLRSLEQLHEIDSLDQLPPDIRQGHFTLPNGTKSSGWKLASPGGAWNATDSIIDPSLPGRRMIFAACNPTICLLHYERGGVAHIVLIMSLTRERDGWKATWLAYGHPPAKNFNALRALLRNQSTLVYHDDTDANIDY